MLKSRQPLSRTLLRTMSAVSEGGGGRNRLRFELSPYLRQHKDNPVDWYPWGSEAIQRYTIFI